MRVFGAFSSRDQSEKAVSALLAEGFDWHHISHVECLVGVNLDMAHSERYKSRIASGGAILCVYCDRPGLCPKAKAMLTSAGATDVFACREACSPPPATPRTAASGR